MAYVLGFLYADGSVYKSERGSYFNVTSADQEIIKKIKKWTKSEHRIVVDRQTFPRKNRYILRVGNKEIYGDLLALGLYPSKSLTIKLPDISKKYFRDFVRGYFDGDGCAYLYMTKGKTQKFIIRKLSAIFTSGSKIFLIDLLKTLKNNINLRRDRVYNSRRSFQLRFDTSDSVALFSFMYNNTDKDLYLKRKYAVFKKYFGLSTKYGHVVK